MVEPSKKNNNNSIEILCQKILIKQSLTKLQN